MKKLSLFITFVLTVSIILTSCGHEHTYSPATCENPRTCTKCGETNGAPVGHQWIEGDCTNAPQCARCKTVRGTALGHTVKIGKCLRCDELIEKKQLDEIYTLMFDVMNGLTDCLKKFVAIKNLFNYHAQEIDGDMNDIKYDLLYIRDKCKNYSELDEIRNAVIEYADKIPETILSRGSNTTTLRQWHNDFKEYFNNIENLFNVFKDFYVLVGAEQ